MNTRELRAVVHIEFCVDLYRIQMEGGRYFLHEHPQIASSWNLDCVTALLKDPRVGLIVADMCQFAMMRKDREGIGQYILKPTRWMSNAPFVLHALKRRCDHGHDHLHLLSGRARAAQIYPERLCTAILKGLKRQLQSDGVISRRFVGSVAPEEENCDEWIEEYMRETWGEYYDIAGNALERSKVQAAKREEIEGLRQRGTYVRVPIAECWSITGKAPIRTRFVDVKKQQRAELSISSGT